MALPSIRGRAAYVFSEPNFDVDLIIGIENIKQKDANVLAALAMRELDPGFRKAVQPGDILVGGENFGYGHPHFPAMAAMRALGIGAVIAESFAPGYWRGEISMGFPQIACLGILALARRWDELEVSWDDGLVRNLSAGTAARFEPLSLGDREMLEAGGIVPYLHALHDSQKETP